MNTALLRRSVLHPEYPGIRLWFCADGTEIAAMPGEQSFTGRYVVVYARADWSKGFFFGYPTRPGGDERLHSAAREFIVHDGCAPRSTDEEDDGGAGAADPAGPEPGEAALLKALEEARAASWPAGSEDLDEEYDVDPADRTANAEDEEYDVDPAELAPGERLIAANLQLKALKEAWAGMSSVSPLTGDRWVRIMCDYSADPVWARSGGNCTLEALPVSSALTARLQAWARLHESKDCSIGVLDWRHRRQFSEEGLAIAEAVKAELPDWTVVYHDEETCEETTWIDDTPRSVFEYEIHGDGKTRAARFAAIAREAGLVAGETLLREGDIGGVFKEILNVQQGRVWVAVRTGEPNVRSGRNYGHRRHFYGDWRKV